MTLTLLLSPLESQLTSVLWCCSSCWWGGEAMLLRASSRPRPGSPLPVSGTNRVRLRFVPIQTHAPEATSSIHFLSGGPRGLLAKAPYAHETVVMSDQRFHRPTSRPTPATRCGPESLESARRRPPSPQRRPSPRGSPRSHSPAVPTAAAEGSPAPSPHSHAAGRSGKRGSPGGGGGPLMLRRARRLHCVRPPARPLCPAPRSAAPREEGSEFAGPAALRPPPSARPV